MGFKTVMSEAVRLSNDSVPRRWCGSGACERPTGKIDKREEKRRFHTMRTRGCCESSCVRERPDSESHMSTSLFIGAGDAMDGGVGGNEESALLQSDPTEEKSSWSGAAGRSTGVDAREPGREADEEGTISACLTVAMVFRICVTSKPQLWTSCSAAS